MKNKFLTLIIFFLGLNCQAQEYLGGFSYGANDADEDIRIRSARRAAETVSLPLFEDFSMSETYPDAAIWQNRSALVNSGFPLFPPNFNAATFDLLDETGKVYSHASSAPFVADSLISNPISLKELTPADSVYFSFYYQPQGNGDAPEASDSLVLMFGYEYEGSVRWNHIWSSPGMTLDSFLIVNDSCYFKHVMIPVADDNYFKNDMYVLFYNYATMPSTMYPNDRSNVDNWNIDLIYLDKNRSYNDDSYPLVTFSEKSPSLLKRYQSMPYRQYVSNPTVAMATHYDMYVTNLDNENALIQYSCHVENMTTGWTYDYQSGNIDVKPYTTNGMVKENVVLKNFLFDMNEKYDTATYIITHVITVDENTSMSKGDTIYGIQSFENYYAYDDGTPERGYGVVPDDSYFASQFTVSTPDTLCGVQLLFNRTYNDANYDFFDIVVWNDNNGRPGNEFYRLKNQRPIWSDTIYKFAYYPFDKMLKVNGTIYVGIMQHSKESINIGFDTSKDNSQYNFFETGNGWENSAMQGSLMIRPVLGSDYVFEKKTNITNKRLGLYPNPSKNEINISELEADSCNEIMIFDMTGRLLKNFNNNVKFDVTDLPNGLYMMRVNTSEGKIYTEKFMISK